MNKKNLIQNYGLWMVLLVVYAGFVLIKNNAWIDGSEHFTPDHIISSGQTPSHPEQPNENEKPDTLPKSGNNAPTTKSSDPLPTPPPEKTSRRIYQPDPIDINSADKKDWETLRGIGDYRSNRILRFREALGGFHSIDQVSETYDLPDSVFEQNRIFLELNTPHKKIKINSVPYDSLHLHPYITKQMAYFIVRHRQNEAPFHEMSQLYNIIAEKDHERLKKFEPYVDFSIR